MMQEMSPSKHLGLDSTSDHIDMSEIEHNLKKEILDESGYASDEKHEMAARTPVEMLSESTEEGPLFT